MSVSLWHHHCWGCVSMQLSLDVITPPDETWNMPSRYTVYQIPSPWTLPYGSVIHSDYQELVFCSSLPESLNFHLLWRSLLWYPLLLETRDCSISQFDLTGWDRHCEKRLSGRPKPHPDQNCVVTSLRTPGLQNNPCLSKVLRLILNHFHINDKDTMS